MKRIIEIMVLVMLSLGIVLTSCRAEDLNDSSLVEDSTMSQDQEENRELLSENFQLNFRGNEVIHMILNDSQNSNYYTMIARVVLPENDIENFLGAEIITNKGDILYSFHEAYSHVVYGCQISTFVEKSEWEECIEINKDNYDYAYFQQLWITPPVIDGVDIVFHGDSIHYDIIVLKPINGTITIYFFKYALFPD